MPADEDNPSRPGQLPGDRLAEGLALRREEDPQALAGPGADGLEDPGDRLDLHDHAGPAAVGVIVGHPVPVRGPGADVVGLDPDEPPVLRFLQQAAPEKGLEHLREDGQDVKAHLRPPPAP
jgi:hypothetical protein